MTPHQFLFEYDHSAYRGRLVFPKVFNEHFNTNTSCIFLTGNNRIRYIVELKYSESNGHFYIRDDEWYAFVAANVPEQTHTIHFILQGVHDYYVTVYDAKESECACYERRTVGPRVTNCLVDYTPEMMLLDGDFLQDILNPNFRLRCDNMYFDDIHDRLRTMVQNKPVWMNWIRGNGWNQFATTVGLEVGQRIVFTNHLANNLSVVVIGGDGLGLNREEIDYTVMRRYGQREPPFHVKDDKRTQKLCFWPSHADHVDENHVFYTPLCAYVSDGFRLTVSSKFCDDHPIFHTSNKAYVVHHEVRCPIKVEMQFDARDPTKTNHVVMKGNWRQFGKDCKFVKPKMLRFKWVDTVTEIKDGEENQVPVFHVC